MTSQLYLEGERASNVKAIIASLINNLGPTLDKQFANKSFNALLEQSLASLEGRSPGKHTLLWSFVLNNLLTKFSLIVESNITIAGTRASENIDEKANTSLEYETTLIRLMSLVQLYLSDVNLEALTHCTELFKNIGILFNDLSISFSKLKKTTQIYIDAILHYFVDLNYKGFNPLLPLVEKNRYNILQSSNVSTVDSAEYDAQSGYQRIEDHITDFKDFHFDLYSSKSFKASLYDDLIEYYYFKFVNLFLSLRYREAYFAFLKLTKVLALNSRFKVTQIGGEVTFGEPLSEDKMSQLELSSLGRVRLDEFNSARLGGGRGYDRRTHHGDKIHSLRKYGGHPDAGDAELYGDLGSSKVLYKSKINSAYFKKIRLNCKQYANHGFGFGEGYHDGEDNVSSGASRIATTSVTKLSGMQNSFIYDKELLVYFVLLSYLKSDDWQALEQNYYKKKYANEEDIENGNGEASKGGINGDLFTQFLGNSQSVASALKAKGSYDGGHIAVLDKFTLLLDIICSILKRDVKRFLEVVGTDSFAKFLKVGDNNVLLKIITGDLLKLLLVNTVKLKFSGIVNSVHIDHLIVFFEEPSVDVYQLLAGVSHFSSASGALIWNLLGGHEPQGSGGDNTSYSIDDRRQILRAYLQKNTPWSTDLETGVVLLDGAARKLNVNAVVEQQFELADLNEEIEYLKSKLDYQEHLASLEE